MAKTKALISFAVTAKLICAFVFAYADCWFSHEVAQLMNAVQPHYNMSQNNAVFNITQPCLGSQMDFFLLNVYCE